MQTLYPTLKNLVKGWLGPRSRKHSTRDITNKLIGGIMMKLETTSLIRMTRARNVSIKTSSITAIYSYIKIFDSGKPNRKLQYPLDRVA